ncbi:MAG: hypothetical protein ACLFQA_00635 [Bacteroidales bacterium]
MWIPSDRDISLASSRQVSAGWRASFFEGLFDAEVNVYHKTLENLASYRERYVNLIGDGNWKNRNFYYFTHDSKHLGLTQSWHNREPFSLYQKSFFPILPTVSYKVFFE